MPQFLLELHILHLVGAAKYMGGERERGEIIGGRGGGRGEITYLARGAISKISE